MQNYCNRCNRTARLEWSEQDAVKSMLSAAKSRAKRAGVPFDLSPEDVMIPNYCPALGLKLERGRGYPTDSSPSLDRIRPSLGYVRGNVVVVSNRANRIKNNATINELRLLADFYAKAE